MPPSHPSDDDRVTEEAADWCLRLQSSDVGDADRAAFERWCLADPRHLAEFDAMREIWGLSAGLRPRVTVAPERAAPPPAAGGPASVAVVRNSSRRRRFAMAACAAAVLTACWPVGWSFGLLPARVDVFLDGARHRTVELPDGSTVDLNVHTTLFYAQFRDRRTVLMDHGEAYFAVAHDAGLPFTVHTAGRQVRVTGTKFNVWANDGDLSVTLTEGSVTVASSTAAAGEPLRLTPGMQGRFARDALFGSVARVDTQRVLSWREGRLVFDNITLAEAVPLLNPYLSRPLRLADRKVGAMRIGGVYDVADLDRVAASLPRVLPVTLSPGDGELLVSAR
ncbi:FecR domain-containing protein [Azospirillum sp. YIM B02556]|uniref:FecR domain-containing protein n=1 Tax=Azospirillum endophyticum TaxID=2800326 RepID=A0ABS1F3V5_9PROT|nr:FecR domain-containing protein [Azospirillum endophyticum]MBK1838039.1 FecR domain-containing protein [Azospirillum endophyticum]